MAKVSILLTSYNHAPFLRQSIESILSQSFHDFELFIVDDGSKDESAEIIRNFHDERIHTVFHEQNQGGPHWMRDVKPRMTGEYFAMAHCDDKWLPGKLQKQVEYLDAHPECGACFTDVQVIDENDRPYTEADGFYFHIFSQENRSRFDWLHRFFYEGNCLCHPSLLIRMTCYDDYGMNEEESLFSLPDYYQWVKLTLHTELYIYPEKLACFRVRKQAGNTSGDKPDGHIRSAFEMFKLLSSYLELKNAPEDFLRVFPSAQKYVRGGKLCVEYAYARILLDESDKPVYNLLGLLILQNLMDDPDTCALLERDYGYTKKSFVAESGGKDVFHTMGDDHFLQSSLYWDTGAGFDSEHFAVRKCYSGFTGRFEVTFTFPEGLHDVGRLRLDPDEGWFRLFEDVVLHIDGEDFTPVPQPPAQERKDGVYFYTADPQFHLQFARKRDIRTVHVTGITRRLLGAEAERETNRLLREARRDREQESSLFWDTGSDFNEAQHATKRCSIDESGSFDVSFMFPERLLQVETLRFDPDENVFREYRNICVEIDGRVYDAVPYGEAQESGRSVRFYTADPQFFVSFHAPTDITAVRVYGETRRLSAAEVEQRTEERVRRVQEQARQTVEEMALNLSSARREQCEEHQRQQEKIDQTQDALNAYQREFEARRTYLTQHRLKASIKALLGKLWTE